MIWILIIIVFAMCCIWNSLRMPRIEAQPLTTDAEYCALMPDVDPEVALKVREILVDVTGWDRDEIHPDTRLNEF